MLVKQQYVQTKTEQKLQALENAISTLRKKSDYLNQRQSDILQRQQDLKTNQLDDSGSKVKYSEQIHLNVGGTDMHVLRETLTLIQGSRLELLFCGRWDDSLLRDEQGRIFLDLDPFYFNRILEYLYILKISKYENATKNTNKPKNIDVNKNSPITRTINSDVHEGPEWPTFSNSYDQKVFDLYMNLFRLKKREDEKKSDSSSTKPSSNEMLYQTAGYWKDLVNSLKKKVGDLCELMFSLEEQDELALKQTRSSSTVSKKVVQGNLGNIYPRSATSFRNESISKRSGFYEDLIYSFKQEQEELDQVEKKLDELERKLSEEEAFVSYFTTTMKQVPKSGEANDDTLSFTSISSFDLDSSSSSASSLESSSEFIKGKNSDPKDEILNLWIDGDIIATKKSSMSVCKGSRLAQNFGSTDWMKKHSFKNENGVKVVLMEHSSVFKLLINQLRLRAMGVAGSELPTIKRGNMPLLERVINTYFANKEDFVLGEPQSESLILQSRSFFSKWVKEVKKKFVPDQTKDATGIYFPNMAVEKVNVIFAGIVLGVAIIILFFFQGFSVW